MGSRSIISLLYRSRVCYIPIMWEQGLVYPCYMGYMYQLPNKVMYFLTHTWMDS